LWYTNSWSRPPWFAGTLTSCRTQQLETSSFHSSLLVLNEINADIPNRNLYQYIVLIQLCNDNQCSRGNNLTGFQVITITKLRRNVVMSKDLSRNELRQFKQSRKIFKFFTKGSEVVANVDLQTSRWLIPITHLRD
jgi:hypothetical protein